uniref:Protein kinase domain-containing protein n=2 Tax=Wuchereria bancrofti TaxID=6293 RepID=A0AAF5PJW5_WUCBA
MYSPLGPSKFSIGDKIKEFLVKKKIGDGSCDMVCLVLNIKDTKRAAMKLEPLMKSKDDEILKMEVYLFKKMQQSKHVCQLLAAGKTSFYNFLIMSLLGKESSDIRRRLHDRKMSIGSVLKIGIQSTTAIHDLHKVGFVHRDIKPNNFAMGRDEKANIVFMFDFGLARQIMFPDKDGKLKLREARKKVAFRGTMHYCSLNVHLCREQERHDDLWSMFCVLIQLLSSTLLWKGMARKDSAHVKQTASDRVLLAGCPDCLRWGEREREKEKAKLFSLKKLKARKERKMSASIAISANPTKVKLTKALNEIKQLKAIQPDLSLPVENQYEQCKEQERKLKKKQQRIESK